MGKKRADPYLPAPSDTKTFTCLPQTIHQPCLVTPTNLELYHHSPSLFSTVSPASSLSHSLSSLFATYFESNAQPQGIQHSHDGEVYTAPLYGDFLSMGMENFLQLLSWVIWAFTTTAATCQLLKVLISSLYTNKILMVVMRRFFFTGTNGKIYSSPKCT